jgi:glyoxylase-like metal-dependent hydrolase (beta-lactamase superfamily II)
MRREGPSGMAGPAEPTRPLLPGVEVRSDLGAWLVIETPGHAPSHVCLHLPEQRLLISGDHVLGRVSLYFDHGYTPDPVGEFLDSLDRVERLDARLCLAGHGRPFTDLPGHIEANRVLVAERLAAVQTALADGQGTAYEVARAVYRERFTDLTASWLLSKTLCWLTHLERRGEAEHDDGSPEVWTAAA